MGSSGSRGGEISGHQGRTSKNEGKNGLSKFSTAKTHLCSLFHLLSFCLLTKIPWEALISGKAKFSMSAPQSPLYLMYSQLHCTTSFFSSVMLSFSSPHLNLSSIIFGFHLWFIYAFTTRIQALQSKDFISPCYFLEGNRFSKNNHGYVIIIHSNYGCVNIWVISKHGNTSNLEGKSSSCQFLFCILYFTELHKVPFMYSSLNMSSLWYLPCSEALSTGKKMFGYLINSTL